MTPQSRKWAVRASALLGAGIVCCLCIAAIGSVAEVKWLAALLTVAAFVLLRVLGSDRPQIPEVRASPDGRTWLDVAKQVLTADEQVLYGIFGHIGTSGYFPPYEFLNEFLMVGCDPCDQDGRMANWQPF